MSQVNRPFYRWVAVVWGVWVAFGVVAQTPPPTFSPTPTIAPRVRVWLPDEFIAQTNTDALTLFTAQSEAFIAIEGVEVDVRARRTNDVGGILATLRAGSLVAPDALPDLTLMRYQDVQVAVREGLLQPLEGKVSSVLLGELGSVLALGQESNRLYGVPYSLDLLHLVYRPQRTVNYSTWDYASVLDRNEPMVFSAGRTTGMSDMLYLQYVANGDDVRQNGTVRLDEEALLELLTFYQMSVDNGILEASTLNYASSADYVGAFASGNIQMALFTSTRALSLRANERTLAFAPVPTQDGTLISLMNGWMWVLMSDDVQQQETALQYVEWMMDAQRQTPMMQTLGMLPSRRTQFRDMLNNRTLATFYEQLLESAVPPLVATNDPFVVALQAGFASVLTKERTAQQAYEALLQQQRNAP